MITKERVVKALKEALAAMNDTGAHWLQGGLRQTEATYDGKPKYCSLGALYYVTGYDIDRLYANGFSPDVQESGDVELREQVVYALASSVESGSWYPTSNYGDCESRITVWNDQRSREWPEVVDAFERAIKSVEQRDQLPDAPRISIRRFKSVEQRDQLPDAPRISIRR